MNQIQILQSQLETKINNRSKTTMEKTQIELQAEKKWESAKAGKAPGYMTSTLANAVVELAVDEVAGLRAAATESTIAPAPTSAATNPEPPAQPLTGLARAIAANQGKASSPDASPALTGLDKATAIHQAQAAAKKSK